MCRVGCHLREQTTTSSLRSSLAHLARAPAAGAAASSGHPICFFPIGRKRLNRKMAQRDRQLSAKSHSARFLVNDDDSARCRRCSLPPFFPTANLTFSTLLYGHINADICHSECSSLSLSLSPRSSPALSLLCGPREPQWVTRVCQCVRRASAQLECEIYVYYTILYNGECGMCIALIWIKIC